MSDLGWILQRLDGLAILDILLVSLVFFLVLLLMRATQAIPLLRGIFVLIVVGLLLGSLSQLPTFGLIVRTAIPALLVAIPVIFQPELRRALERLGRFNEVLVQPRRNELEAEVRTISDAVQRLAAHRYGALIVLERDTGLQGYIDTGVKLDALLSAELLLTIFHPNTPLHDGGVIVRRGRIAAAACVLPLTSSHIDDYHMGLRHRAGIGVTEGTDAVAIIVSEERGTTSIAHEGRLIFAVELDRLESALIEFLKPGLGLRRTAAWPVSWFRSRGR
ncbi:MAG: diadenylate cyclase CdaA [Anaerolineae bacterium]|nr:diadenylate cyclase CdaA [Thermoflexales bacterium]MDW8406942.1 diadenylate cyclase CdaA [Anaerolineae bacterium]